MESRLGHDLAAVRVHHGPSANRAARALGARAFTVGSDIVFAGGQYTPATHSGRQTLAHELSHVIQQGRGAVDGQPIDGGLTVSDPSDRFERAAERTASDVMSLAPGSQNGRAGDVDGPVPGRQLSRRPVAGASLAVQRDFFDDAVAEASNLADAATETASGVVSAVGEAASSVADAASGALDSAAGVVSSAASAVGDAASAGVAAVTGAASDAAAAVASSPLLSAAVAQASGLAAMFGGSVSLVGTKLIITLPQFPIMGAKTTPLVELPSAIVRLPFFVAGGAIGPVLLEGDIALEVAIRPEVIAVVGPADVRGVRIELDPFAGSYSATGTLHISGSNSLIVPVEAGLDVEVIAVIMAGEVPIPVEVDAFGGLRLALRGSGLGSLDETVTLAYNAGALSLDSLTTLKLGARIDAELDATVELNLYEEPLCIYTWPLANWLLAENAEQYDLPVTLSYADGTPSVEIGPITSKPIPVTDIEAKLPTLPRTRDCSPLDRLIEILCRKGVIPPELCDIEGHGGGAEFGPTSAAATPTVVFHSSVFPNIAPHIKKAQASGKPKTLHRLTDPDQIRRNRRAACGSFTGPGTCDEYPFASSHEGGAGASTTGVPLSEQRSQGGLLSSFYQREGLGDGDPYRVRTA